MTDSHFQHYTECSHALHWQHSMPWSCISLWTYCLCWLRKSHLRLPRWLLNVITKLTEVAVPDFEELTTKPFYFFFNKTTHPAALSSLKLNYSSCVWQCEAWVLHVLQHLLLIKGSVSGYKNKIKYKQTNYANQNNPKQISCHKTHQDYSNCIEIELRSSYEQTVVQVISNSYLGLCLIFTISFPV